MGLSIGGVTSGGVATPTSAFWAKPTSPNAFDDECDSGSPDLADRGLYVWDMTLGAVLTREGDVKPSDPASTTLNTNAQYRSTLTKGGLLMQFGSAPRNILITKAHELAENAIVYASLGMAFHRDVGGNLSFRVLLTASQTTDANCLLSQKRRASMTENNDQGIYSAGVFTAAPNSGNAPTNVVSDIVGVGTLRVNGTTTDRYHLYANASSGSAWGFTATGPTHLATWPYAGLFIELASGTNRAPYGMFYLRFLRAKSDPAGLPFIHSI